MTIEPKTGSKYLDIIIDFAVMHSEPSKEQTMDEFVEWLRSFNGEGRNTGKCELKLTANGREIDLSGTFVKFLNMLEQTRQGEIQECVREELMRHHDAIGAKLEEFKDLIHEIAPEWNTSSSDC